VKVLVTGGAGFIGSSLVHALVNQGAQVMVLDDLSTGNPDNLGQSPAELRTGDIRDPDAVGEAVRGADVVYHLAALPSVARSVADPVRSHEVNASGTLEVLVAARDAGTRRVVYASSSSVYGDTPTLPKHEAMSLSPQSPYAAAKLAGESYCRAFSRTYGLETVALRFFNVFGPRQDPASEYAAVIPRFITRMMAGERPMIFGDGRQSRDFTFVGNVVRACIDAAGAERASGEVMNVGFGGRTSLLELVAMLNNILDTELEPEFGPSRPGDVRHSEASIDRARELIDYRPAVGLEEGLRETVTWFAARPGLERSRV
jgi:UDP-N-acetylglucosamine/UDP-N-acetyl-alpha-D-glucosaminouronate 4-epimerase